ncbi:MAG TPA: hypothetical protein P5081_13555 [Phycisphaerae bacterium]|nr:hypothetical protein [Phycisphaerae bacterium]HRW53903.1 hypothetical protein [Phycisphaerae bacterium]
MMNIRWRSELRRIQPTLRGANGSAVHDEASDGDVCNSLDTALREGVLVDARRQVKEERARRRDALMSRLQVGEVVQTDESIPFHQPRGGRIHMLLQHRALSAAAAIVIAAGVWLTTALTSNTARANTVFAQMLAKVNEITFICEAHEKTGPVESVTKVYSGGDGLERTEFNVLGVSFVMIFKDSTVYDFDPMRNIVRIGPAMRVAETGARLLEQLRAYQNDASAESLGEKDVGGVRCFVYRYEWIKDKPETPEDDSSIIEIAVNSETRYPVRIAYLEYPATGNSNHGAAERFEAVVVENFEWNIAIDPRLFDTTIPDGWTTQDMPANRDGNGPARPNADE